MINPSFLSVCLGLAMATAASADPLVKQPDGKKDIVVASAEPAPPATGRAGIMAAIERTAQREGLPAEIAEAVTHTESGFNPNVIGGAGEIGLMQVLPSTARMMGFSGSLTDLAVPETNIQYGVKYLARAWRLGGRDICTTVMKYRAGHGETRFSHLSVDYCLKVRARLKARGFAVAGVVPAATFGNPAGLGGRSGGKGGGGCRGICLAGSGGSANVDALNSKLSAIVFRVKTIELQRQ